MGKFKLWWTLEDEEELAEAQFASLQPSPGIQIFDEDNSELNTGLLDHEGNEIFRAENRLGFLHFEEE